MAVPTDDVEFKAYLIELLKDPELCRAVHLYADTDKTKNSIHHTVGPRTNQAASN